MRRPAARISRHGRPPLRMLLSSKPGFVASDRTAVAPYFVVNVIFRWSYFRATVLIKGLLWKSWPYSAKLRTFRNSLSNCFPASYNIYCPPHKGAGRRCDYFSPSPDDKSEGAKRTLGENTNGRILTLFSGCRIIPVPMWRQFQWRSGER